MKNNRANRQQTPRTLRQADGKFGGSRPGPSAVADRPKSAAPPRGREASAPVGAADITEELLRITDGCSSDAEERSALRAATRKRVREANNVTPAHEETARRLLRSDDPKTPKTVVDRVDPLVREGVPLEQSAALAVLHGGPQALASA